MNEKIIELEIGPAVEVEAKFPDGLIQVYKGDSGVIPYMLVMDDCILKPTDTLRVCSINDIYTCVFEVQVYYFKTGKWIIHPPN